MYKIARELEWRYDDFQSIWTADSPVGTFHAWEISGYGCYVIPGWVPRNIDGGLVGAKAAVQEHFEKQAREIISPAFLASIDGQKPAAWIAQSRWDRMTSAEPWLTNTVYSEDQSGSFPCIPLFSSPVSTSLRKENVRMREALEQIAVKANNGKCHGLLADAHCEDIEEIALAAIGRKP